MKLPQQLATFADTHHGIVSYDAAKAVGIDASRWARFVTECGLEQLHWNVARLRDSEESHLQRIQAAVLSCGPGALASHRSAAALWGCEIADKSIDVTIPSRSSIARPGVTIHRPRYLSDLGPVVRKGIACTNPLRMLADLGAVAAPLVTSAMDQIILAKLAKIGRASCRERV